MANVLFKRGLQANLPSSSATVVDGAFYLTTDTNRLYVGNEGTLQLLNKNVTLVADLTALRTISSAWTTTDQKQAHEDDFYYVKDGNMLVIWRRDPANPDSGAYGWHQVNPDNNTVIEGAEFGTSASNGVTTVSYTVTDSAGTATVASFGIEGAGGITASTTGSNVLLTGTTYSLGAVADAQHNEASVMLTDSHNATSSAVIVGGDNVTVSGTGTHGIYISAVDTVVEGAEFAFNNGQMSLTITDSAGTATVAVATAVGVVLNDGSRVTIGDVSGVTSVGAIYSKNEIDNIVKGLNGMTYKGTIASSGTVATVHTLPTQNVRQGDVYVVSDNDLTTSDLGNDVVSELAGELSNGIRIGDMFIATGAEGSDGYITTPQWTFIPSGNDSAAQFTYNSEATTSTNTIAMTNELEQTIMAVTLTGGTQVNVVSSSVNGNDINATISHATINTTATTSAAASKTTFSAVSGVTVDNGHVTAINTETFTISEYAFTDTLAATAAFVNSSVFNGTQVTSATNAGLNDVHIGTNLLQDDATISSSLLKLSSESIILSKGNDGEVVMNLEWGKF